MYRFCQPCPYASCKIHNNMIFLLSYFIFIALFYSYPKTLTKAAPGIL